MEIKDRTYVSINYKLTLDSGETVDETTDSPFGFICGAGMVIPGLEEGIKGKKEGDNVQLTIEPADAYGEFRDDLVKEIPRSNFPPDIQIEPGMPFEAQSPHGPVRFTVKEVTDEVVKADFNHPLAGERLHFDITIKEVREPSVQEMSQIFGGGGACNCTPTSGCDSCGGGCG